MSHAQSKHLLGKAIGLAVWLLTTIAVQAAPSDYFKILVVDEQTGRGVPLAELKTVSNAAGGRIARVSSRSMNRGCWIRKSSFTFGVTVTNFPKTVSAIGA